MGFEKKKSSLNGKITFEGALLFRTYQNLSYLLEGIWRVLMEKNRDAIEGRSSVVKCGETLFGGVL